MKYQTLLSGKNKKKLTKLWSAEFSHSEYTKGQSGPTFQQQAQHQELYHNISVAHLPVCHK